MFKRQRTGSVVCASCGSLVGVNDEKCYTCGRRNPGLWGYAPVVRRLGNDLGFVPLILYGCSALYAAGILLSLARGANPLGGGGPLNLLAPSSGVQLLLGASGAVPFFQLGMWWTVLSAGWLHGSILHIFFNMMWVRNVGPATAELYGGPRMVIIYTIASVTGFLLSSFLGQFRLPLFGAGLTVGASAPIFGLFGALMYYGRRSGSSLIHSEAKGYAVAIFAFGLIFPGVDNAAHLGGLGGGYFAAMWLDPLKPERVNHMVGALACLIATALAIVASVLKIYPMLPYL